MRKQRHTAALLVGAALALAGAGAAAQGRSGGLGGAAATVEDLAAGSPRTYLDLSATAGLDVAFDSNVYNGRGPDEVTRVSPRLALRYHDRANELKLSYDLGWWTYAVGKADPSLNHRAIASWNGQLSRRLAVYLADEFIRAEDPGFLSRSGVVAPQTGITDNTLDALASYRLFRRFDLVGGYSYRVTFFDEQPPGRAPLYDGTQHDIQGAGVYKVTRTDELRLGHRVQYFTAEGNDLAVTNSPGVGWRHQFRRDLELRGEVGPVAYSALGAATANGWTWRGAAVFRYYTPSWRAALSYTHDLIGGTGAATVLWGDFAYAQVGYHLNDRLDIHGGFGVFANGLAPSGATLYDGFNVDAIADVRLFANLRAAAYYSFRWQEAAAAAPLEPVTRNIVGVRLFAVFGAEARPPRREVHP